MISGPFYQNRYQNFWANGFWTPGATKKLPGLKILVSVVRFRPGPPRFYKPPSGGFFICAVLLVNCFKRQAHFQLHL
ncbi:hypothetical protein AOC33_04080 [Polynucleobacter cosmopolitanus]|uniref:Uncharacterized protein n=1 Tax=Polynucleobacter cosmopolitanus TaxID=351345 RepID=A0A229FXT9_9BURK|nr:hypothetical protein AOC33_04080 [Polynucleobacter cosmopolitanus]